MYPFFEPINGFFIYSFGLTITICFFLFLWMLKKLSIKYNFDFSIFKKNIIWFFLSVFIFSRLFYIISKWNDLKYINNPIEFFIMNDYNFSLIGGIIGFFIVLLINLKLKKENINKYIDGVVISIIFVLIVGYIGAFLGGQVYGRETSIGIEVSYNHPFTPVPYQIPIFPLAIVYSICYFILFSVLYILAMYTNIKGFLGYVGIIAFSSIILIFEFFSGKNDIFKDHIYINFPQIFALIFIGIGANKLYKLLKIEK